MKFTLVALLAALCVVAVTANVAVEDFSPQDEADFLYVPLDIAGEENVDFENLSAFSGMYWVLKAALRTLKGINCSIKGVLNIKAAAQQFIDDVNSCGGTVSKQVQSVITACKNVISTANSIININNGACKNGDNNEETEGNQKTPFFSCFLKILNKFLTLNKQIQKVLSLIQKVPDATTGAGVCVHTALVDLQSAFTQFPTYVKNCSKLTSN